MHQFGLYTNDVMRRKKNDLWSKTNESYNDDDDSKKKKKNWVQQSKIGGGKKAEKTHTNVIPIAIGPEIEYICCSMTIIKLDRKSHRKIIELRILYYLHDDINTSDMICY